ncbi:MAG: LCP family protein [Cyanobacteriota bacterium]|jgi:LCP family protein required for cell wall assembly
MPRRRSSPSRRPRRFHSGWSVLLAIALGWGAGFALSAPLAKLVFSADKGAPRLPWSNPFSAWANIGQEDVLILGMDVGGGNTDVIATARVEGGETTITQIPRDSYIESDQYGAMKINALYTVGGIQALEHEISTRMGRPIRHHVVLNLGAIRRIADMMGGIEVNVPKRMFYTDNSQGLYIDLQPGPQTLKGRDLEGFLRFRHDETGDIGRMERQQLAVQALFRKLTRPDQFVRLPALLMNSGKDLRTDMGPMELGGLITAISTTKLNIHHLEGRPFDQGGVSYLDIDWPALAESSPKPENPESSPLRSFFLF